MLAETESLLKALDEANVFVLNNICRSVRCPLPHCELTLIAGIGDKHKYETSKVGCVVSIQTGGCPTSTLLSTNMTLATDMWSLDTNLGLYPYSSRWANTVGLFFWSSENFIRCFYFSCPTEDVRVPGEVLESWVNVRAPPT